MMTVIASPLTPKFTATSTALSKIMIRNFEETLDDVYNDVEAMMTTTEQLGHLDEH